MVKEGRTDFQETDTDDSSPLVVINWKSNFSIIGHLVNFYH